MGWRQKLRSRRGLTLTEVLVSLALTGILAAGISTGVSATGPVLEKSLALSESQLLLDTLVKGISGELRNASDVTVIPAGGEPVPPLEAGQVVTGKASFTYTSAEYGLGAFLYTVENDGGGEERIHIMVNGGGYDFLGSGAYSNLGARLNKLEYDEAGKTFDVEIEIVFPNGTAQAHQFEVRSVLEKS